MMKKTKVIEFIPTVGDGGAETLVKDYATLIDRNLFELTVVVQHALEDSANLRHLKEHGIPVIALSSQDDVLKKVWRRIFWRKKKQKIKSEEVQEKSVLPGDDYEEASALRRLRNCIRNLYFGLLFLKVQRKIGASVVHIHLDLLGCVQAVRHSLKGVRLFHTCHAPPALIYVGEESQSAKCLIRHNDLQLIALHENMAKEMDAMFPEQSTKVIRNGVNLARFQNPECSRTEKRAELGISQDAFVVGHVGRFTPEKNHPFLVEVFKEIAQRQENPYLLMIGAEDHSHIDWLLQGYGLKECYQILSHRKDIPELLAAMDVFVFPSIFEGFGISTIEAQAADLRCIISDRCPSEVCRTKKCFLMPLVDPAKWAEQALCMELRAESEQDLMEYDMNREIQRLEQLYLGKL